MFIYNGVGAGEMEEAAVNVERVTRLRQLVFFVFAESFTVSMLGR